jgi:hypothetical protein
MAITAQRNIDPLLPKTPGIGLTEAFWKSNFIFVVEKNS